MRRSGRSNRVVYGLVRAPASRSLPGGPGILLDAVGIPGPRRGRVPSLTERAQMRQSGIAVGGARMNAQRRTAYDRIGSGYGRRRRDEPIFAAAIREALGAAERVLNVGAGTGSYEPDDRQVVALEPSEVMIRQRRPGPHPVVRGVAEAMPFGSEAFDVVMAVLTVHHWSDRSAGFAELRRVATRRVVLTFDPEVHNRLWLMDYIPELAVLENRVPLRSKRSSSRSMESPFGSSLFRMTASME